MNVTYTRSHVYIRFADPYLECDRCRHLVAAWHDGDACGCGGPSWSQPCGHGAGVTSRCPSWSPVDGCRCLAHLGYVPHPTLGVPGVDHNKHTWPLIGVQTQDIWRAYAAAALAALGAAVNDSSTEATQ